MASVTVRLPSLLAPMVGGTPTIAVDADTLAGALDELVRRHPELRVHIYDESGKLRRHVLCFHNQTNVRWLDELGVPLAAGDTITIYQAVSGG